MKKVALAIAALAIGTVGASAADMAPRYAKAPMAAPVAIYNWTGFYVGLSAGGGWGDTRWQYALTPGVNTNHSSSGWLAGGQAGYNWQSGAWVFGVEGDAHWADINGSTLCPNPALVCGTDIRTLASIRGRLGYAAGSMLFYGTAGGAYADTRYAATPGTFAYTSERWGYAAGAGIEWGFAPNWSAKLEYMHYGFDTDTSPAGTLGAGPADLRLDIDTVKVGINYRFGGPGAVVAKY